MNKKSIYKFQRFVTRIELEKLIASHAEGFMNEEHDFLTTSIIMDSYDMHIADDLFNEALDEIILGDEGVNYIRVIVHALLKRFLKENPKGAWVTLAETDSLEDAGFMDECRKGLPNGSIYYRTIRVTVNYDEETGEYEPTNKEGFVIWANRKR